MKRSLADVLLEIRKITIKDDSKYNKQIINKAIRICMPIALEQVARSGAMIVSTGIVSLLEIESIISDSQEIDSLEFFAFLLTIELLLNVHIPPSLEIDLELTTELVFGALWIIFNPVSRFCPFPAKDILVNSQEEPTPDNTLSGYNIDTREPNDPIIHSIFPFSST